MSECKRCGKYEYRWLDKPCACRLFECALPYRNNVVDSSEWEEIYAIDASASAERFCERRDSDSADYNIIRDGGAEVWVKDEAGVIHKFDVIAESVPQYHANEVKPTEQTAQTGEKGT